MFEMIHAEIESTTETPYADDIAPSRNEEEQFSEKHQESQNENETFETSEYINSQCQYYSPYNAVNQTNQQYTENTKKYVKKREKNNQRNLKQTLMDEYMYQADSRPSHQGFSPNQTSDTSHQLVGYDSPQNTYINDDVQSHFEKLSPDFLLDNEDTTLDDYSNYELEQESPITKRLKSTHSLSPYSSYNYVHRPTLEERILHYNTLQDRSELWKEYSIQNTPKRVTSTPFRKSPQFFEHYTPSHESIFFEKNPRTPLSRRFINEFPYSDSARKSSFTLDFSTPSRASNSHRFCFSKHLKQAEYPEMAFTRGTKRKFYQTQV